MRKTEASKTTLWQKWYRENIGTTCAYEVKVARHGNVFFAQLEEHQKNWLLAVKHGTAIYKMPDAGFFNPFDGFCLAKEAAWVVLYYNHNFYMIDIDAFVEAEKNNERRSLTESMAKELASYSNIPIIKHCKVCNSKIEGKRLIFCSDKCQRKTAI